VRSMLIAGSHPAWSQIACFFKPLSLVAMRLSTSIALFVPALAVAGTLGRHSDAEDIADGALELKASSASETMSASTVKPSIVIV
jgi:hypothetical protein